MEFEMGLLRLMICFVPMIAAACSTGHLTPDIGKFGETVGAIGTRDANSAAGRSLPDRVSSARRADFAAAGVQYGTSDRDACEYNRPDVAIAAQRFDEACALVPLKLVNNEPVTAASEYDPVSVQAAAKHIVKARNIPLLREQLGYGIRTDLIAYSQALTALAKSDDPAAIGTAAGNAFDAITGLQDAASAAASATGQPVPAGSARKPARTLVSTLSREVAETLRYKRLKSVVESADPYVTVAAVQLSILTFEGEKASLEGQSARMMEAIDDLSAGSEANLAEIEASYAAMADADSRAAFRGYAEIGRTHRAIRAALNGPADIKRLSEANKRIVALAVAFQDLAAAVE
jgi:hypothetical protein